MDKSLKDQAAELRKMESVEAAKWLITNYPIDDIEYGSAFALMKHRSWRKPDQITLARYYLQKIPFSNTKFYESFLSFMSLSSFLKAIKMFLPLENSSDTDLLIYHLKPALEGKAKSSNDSQLIKEFFSEVR